MKTTNLKSVWMLALIVANGVVGMGATAATPATAAVIYQDAFSRSGNLNGSSPDIGSNPWVASTSGTADTTDGTQVLNQPGHAAFLPFTPANGLVYTLSADLNTSATTNFWEALGFSDNNNTGTNSFHVIPGNTVGPWLLQTGNGTSPDSTFLGPGTSGQNDPTVASSNTGYANYAIVLNTINPTAWTVAFHRNGSLMPGTTTYTYVTNPTINYVGFGNSQILGNVDNFMLTVVPEPSGILSLIMGLGFIGTLRRRNVQRKD